MSYLQQMLTRSLSVLKKWSLPLFVVYAIALTLGSLVNTGGMPNLGSEFDDKIYHSIAYTIFTFVTYNYLVFKSIKYKLFYASLFVIAYGIIIEVLQHILTVNRTLDANDVLANIIGVVLAVTILLIGRRIILKMNA